MIYCTGENKAVVLWIYHAFTQHVVLETVVTWILLSCWSSICLSNL